MIGRLVTDYEVHRTSLGWEIVLVVSEEKVGSGFTEEQARNLAARMIDLLEKEFGHHG